MNKMQPLADDPSMRRMLCRFYRATAGTAASFPAVERA